METSITYESAAAELETILNDLRSDSISIDELAKKVERASELLKFCSDKLKTTEVKVTEVIQKIGL